MNALARIGLIQLLGQYSRMGMLFGGASPPVELSERAGFLYRPQAIQAGLDEIAAIEESIRLVNETAKPNAWGNLPVRIVAAYKGDSLPQTLSRALDSLAQQSTNGRVVSVKGSHFLHFEQPDLVAQTILEIVEAAP